MMGLINCCFIQQTTLFAQLEPTYFEFTAKANKDKTITALQQSIKNTLALPFGNEQEKLWKSAFWAMSLMQYTPAELTQRLPIIIQNSPYNNASLQWILLEGLYSLYPAAYAKEVEKIWQQFKTPKLKVLALEYLRIANIYPTISPDTNLINSNHFKLYRQQLSVKNSIKHLQANDFLNEKLLPSEVVLISFQHKDRNKPGYLMIRSADGKWLKDSVGKAYQFMQLARSITNMPFYLTNGNTPQGLFKLAGFDQSNNLWIGPSTNLQMVMPFEKEIQKSFLI